MAGVVAKQVHPETLVGWLKDKSTKVMVVDVRDDDFEGGGHLHQARNFPSTTLDAQMNQLIKATMPYDK